MTNIATRLKNHADQVLDPGYPFFGTPELVREAAVEIKRLTRLVTEARKLLADCEEAIPRYIDGRNDQIFERIEKWTASASIKRTTASPAAPTAAKP